MARLRTIKAELWTSEQIISCSPLARLLFIGLLNFCDDGGVHPASCLRLKLEVFPGDSFAPDEIKNWINELVKNQLLIEYKADDGKQYWQVTGWKNHQKIDRPTYKFPPPNSENLVEKKTENSTTARRGLDEHSASTSRVLDESSGTERSRVELNEEELKDICEVAAQASLVSADKPKTDKKQKAPAEVLEIFSYWRQKLSHPKAKLDEKRKRKIIQALKNYCAEDLRQAIDGCSKSPFNMGQNDNGQKYDDLELILRDSKHIEQFITTNSSMPQQNFASNKFTQPSSNLFAGAI